MKLIYAMDHITVQYAAQEFIRLAAAVGMPDVELCKADALPRTPAADAVVLGLLADLNRPADDLNDPFIEDILDLEIENGCGIIAGSNERSILMGVYRYFYFAGCRWVRPGANGEYLPAADLTKLQISYRKKADYPFRGECSEGAISYEHMRDTVYWLPKVGMNMYMIEGLVPYTYMHKWYGHIANTKLRIPGQITDYQMLEEKIALLEKDIVRTGVQFHNIGHGWMFEPLGIHHCGPGEAGQLREEDKQYLAQVNGVRGLYHNSTFFTHYCYSNPAARKLLVDWVVKYLKEKPYIDFMHVWLADTTNNQCECEECVKMTPSDHYVVLLNELDEAMEKEGLTTRLVFILYVDTVRPPVLQRLRHPERFLLLAAIGSNYEQPYRWEDFEGEEPPFVRNHFVAPTNALRMRWHRQWKELCNNIPSCIFEYRFYVDQYCDIAQMQITRETWRDMRALKDVDFQGNMDDQTHRCYLPTALPMITMAETLFDINTNLEDLSADYFRSAFGNDGELVHKYLEEMTRLFCPSRLRQTEYTGAEEDGLATAGIHADNLPDNETFKANLRKIPALIDAFLPEIDRHVSTMDNDTQCKSWWYLTYHARIARGLAETFLIAAEGNLKGAQDRYAALEDEISGFEMDIHEVFDYYLMDRYMRRKLGLPALKYYV